MSEWKDITTYRRGDTERIPSMYEIQGRTIRIVITCAYRHLEGRWVMHCPKIGIDTHIIEGCTSVGEAMRTSVKIVSSAVSRLKAEADAFPSPPE